MEQPEGHGAGVTGFEFQKAAPPVSPSSVFYTPSILMMRLPSVDREAEGSRPVAETLAGFAQGRHGDPGTELLCKGQTASSTL